MKRKLESNWKPIATAPRGQRILLFLPATEGVDADCVVGSFERLSQREAVYAWVVARDPKGVHREKILLAREPSHWMALPDDPPVKSKLH